MVERIGVWAIEPSEAGKEVAQPLEELANTETEQRLEELFVSSPDVLLPGLSIVGRQVPTDGGPLDLLGVDDEGRLVLFELKRGMLTRDAIAQVIDYASDLASRTPEDLASLVERSSGRLGVERIDDFLDWYQGEFPDAAELPPTRMRLFLVGLGVDDRAKRMANHLAKVGLDIQVLTFHAFHAGGKTFLARKVESVEPQVRSAAAAVGQKERNQRQLAELAKQQGVEGLLNAVADFVSTQMPSYRWPGKTSIGYYLVEQTDAGKPTQRAYASVAVDGKVKGRVVLSLTRRAVQAVPDEIARICHAIPGVKRTESDTTALQILISATTWDAMEQPLGALLAAVFNAWKARVREQGATELASAADVEP